METTAHEEHFYVDSFLHVMDKLVVALTVRWAAYEEISGKFDLRQLTTASPDEIDTFA